MSQNAQGAKHKFNFIDVIIILAVIAVAAAAVFIFGANQLFGDSQTVGVEYVLEFRQVREEFLGNFETGVEVVDASKKYRLGEVTAVSSTATIFTGTNLIDGTLYYSEYPERFDVTLTVSAQAKIDSDGMYILDEGYRMSVGTTVYVRTPNFTGTAYCTQIKKTEA